MWVWQSHASLGTSKSTGVAGCEAFANAGVPLCNSSVAAAPPALLRRFLRLSMRDPPWTRPEWYTAISADEKNVTPITEIQIVTTLKKDVDSLVFWPPLLIISASSPAKKC